MDWWADAAFACGSGLSYGCVESNYSAIPDNSKPTVTWGRKAMGQVAGPHHGNMVARPPKESRL